jgi:hypothetical protein
MSATITLRSQAIAERVIGISISNQPENLLARGLGVDHLRELLLRLARPLLRHGASLAYGGHWKPTDDNFTFDLLRLVNAERLDSTVAVKDAGTGKPTARIGQLFCYSAWPDYYEISKGMEAQWMNCCRILRINQQRAKLKKQDWIKTEDLDKKTPDLAFNHAVCLSAMRRIPMKKAMYIMAEDLAREKVPKMSARILLGGKLDGYPASRRDCSRRLCWPSNPPNPHPRNLSISWAASAAPPRSWRMPS